MSILRTVPRHTLRGGFSLSKIDHWFLVQINEIVDFEEGLWGARN